MKTTCRGERELSVRVDPRSGELRNEVHECSMPSPKGEQRIVILLHGFNVNQEKAEAAYSRFTEGLTRFGWPEVLKEKIWKFYWPGNLTNPLLSALSYPHQVPKAIEAAKLLSSYLNVLSRSSQYPIEVYFIGHSLGCRLILEANCHLSRLRRGHRPLVTLVSLMAAAIPVEMLQKRGRLVRGRNYPRSIAALYSPNDRTLARWFPFGQILEGVRSEAVGLHGNPKRVWTAGYLDTQLDHTEYWGDDLTARFLATIFGIAVSRVTPTRRNLSRVTPKYVVER